MNLNQIEKLGMRKIIEKSDANTCIVDCFDIKPSKFKTELKGYYPDINIITEHKADDKYVVVAAASIVAKVERDNEILKIRKNIRILGPGTPVTPKPYNL